MKPLVIDQRVFTWFGVFPLETTPKLSTKLIFSIFVVVISAWSLSSLLSSGTYFFRYMSVDLELSLYALFQLAATLIVANAIIIILLSRWKISSVFRNLEMIYEESTMIH